MVNFELTVEFELDIAHDWNSRVNGHNSNGTFEYQSGTECQKKLIEWKIRASYY